MILEADHVVCVGQQILLPELDSRKRRAPYARINETDRLHRAEAQRVVTAPRQLFNRQTRLEPARLLEALQRHRLCADESFRHTTILFFIERAVEIIVAAFVVTRGAESD